MLFGISHFKFHTLPFATFIGGGLFAVGGSLFTEAERSGFPDYLLLKVASDWRLATGDKRRKFQSVALEQILIGK